MFPHNKFCMQKVASVTFMPFLKIHNFIIYHPNSKKLGNYVERYIDCGIVKFCRILMYLDVTLQTLNMVCRKFKIYISSFSCMCSYETISHMNEVKAESPSTRYIVNIYPEFQRSIHIHYKVTVSCENLSGREKLSASRDFTVCNIRCVYRAEFILGI